MDLRERALARKAAGETHRQIAEALQIAPSCVSKWARRERETGSPAPAQVGGYKRRTLSGPAADWLRARIAAGPFTLQGLSDELAEEQARPDVARRRKRWKAHQMKVEPQRLVFIDETWIKTNMAPLRGWAPRGKRLRAYAPFGHWKTLTFIAALRCDRIEAPFVLDGPINGQAFRLYVETQLAPTLRPGDVVVMDNLGSHKGKAARAAIRSRGAHLLFLPAYSPDLNPIEQVFAKLKHLMRKSQPRGVEAAWRTAGQILERFTPNECANSLVNAGYGSV
jgi:transposase